MKEVLPLLKHPTTTVFIDDSALFLNELKVVLASNSNCVYFTNPVLARDFIVKNRETINDSLFYKLEDPNNHGEIQVSFALEKIKHALHNNDRASIVSTVVVDYDMPGIDGLQLCASLNQPNVYKILLTGMAEDKMVIDAFHKGIINAYISKTSPDFIKELLVQIEKGGDKYFDEITSFLTRIILMDKDNRTYINNRQYIDFFLKYIKDNDITECYIIERIGSYILKSSTGAISKLYIADDVSMQTMMELLPNDVDERVVNYIKMKNKMFCFNEVQNDNNLPIVEPHMHPCNKIEGDDNLYYCVVNEK